MEYKLRFPLDQVENLADRYIEKNLLQAEEDEIVNEISPRVKLDGLYTKEQFLKVCDWKTHRTRTLCEKNNDALVAEVTKTALTAESEELRIGILTLLGGVGWPTASVLLHFGHSEQYPILDIRALWSLNVPEPSQYGHEFWWGYVLICRQFSKDCEVDMRTLDRALWQFSFEKQGLLRVPT